MAARLTHYGRYNVSGHADARLSAMAFQTAKANEAIADANAVSASSLADGLSNFGHLSGNGMAATIFVGTARPDV